MLEKNRIYKDIDKEKVDISSGKTNTNNNSDTSSNE